MDELAPEIVQKIVFESGVLGVEDVGAVAMTCVELRDKVQGTEYDRRIHRALLGALECAQRGWWASARVAFRRRSWVNKEQLHHLVFEVVTLYEFRARQTRESGEEEVDDDLGRGGEEEGGEEAYVKLVVDVLSNPGVNVRDPPMSGATTGGFPYELASWFGVEQDYYDYDEEGDGRAFTVLDLAQKFNNPVAFCAVLGDPDLARVVRPEGNSSDLIIRTSQQGQTQMVEALLADGRADPTVRGSVALGKAGRLGHPGVVRALLEDGRVEVARYSNELRMMGRQGHSSHTREVLELFLAHPDIDPTVGDNSAIRYAAEKGSTEIVRVLLDDGRVDVGAMDSYAIRWAKTEEIKAMLEAHVA